MAAHTNCLKANGRFPGYLTRFREYKNREFKKTNRFSPQLSKFAICSQSFPRHINKFSYKLTKKGEQTNTNPKNINSAIAPTNIGESKKISKGKKSFSVNMTYLQPQYINAAPVGTPGNPKKKYNIKPAFFIERKVRNIHPFSADNAPDEQGEPKPIEIKHPG